MPKIKRPERIAASGAMINPNRGTTRFYTSLRLCLIVPCIGGQPTAPTSPQVAFGAVTPG